MIFEGRKNYLQVNLFEEKPPLHKQTFLRKNHLARHLANKHRTGAARIIPSTHRPQPSKFIFLKREQEPTGKSVWGIKQNIEIALIQPQFCIKPHSEDGR